MSLISDARRLLSRTVERTPLNPLTVEQMIEQYFVAEKGSLADSTMGVRRAYLLPVVKYMGRHRVALLSPRDSDGYRTWRDGQPTARGNANWNTASYELRALRTVINWAVKRQMIASNPLQGMNVSVSQGERSLTWEANQLTRASQAGNVQLEAIMEALYDSGMRVGEVIKNTIDNLKMAAHEDSSGVERLVNVLVVPASISKTRRQRVAVLRPEAAAKLRELPRTGRWLVESTQRRDRPVSYSTVRVWLIEAAADSGVTAEMGARPYTHSLRHSYGTDAMRAGVNPEALAKTLGHASLTTTSIYTHANLDDQVLAAAKTWEERARQLERKPPKSIRVLEKKLDHVG